MKLSTTTTDVCVNNSTPDVQIRMLSTIGFKHFNLEMSVIGEGINDEDFMAGVEKTRIALKETGTDCVLAHSTCRNLATDSYDFIVRETVRSICACEKLGIPDIVVHPLYKNDFHPRQMYEFNRNYYRDLMAETPNSPVHLLIENFADNEVAGNCLSSGYDMRDFLEYMGESRMGACWDTAHCSLTKKPRDDQYTGIKALEGWLRALHISDNFATGLHWHSFPFSGIINFDAVMCALLEIGYQGAFNFEASYIVRNPKVPPIKRKEWVHPTDANFVPKLYQPPVELKLKADELLYATGKYILEQYGVFEE